MIRWSSQRLNKAEEREEWKRETAHNETERKLNLWDHKELEIFHGYSVCLFFVQHIVQVLLLRCLLLSLPHQKKVYYGFWTHNCWWQFVVRSDHPKSFSTSIYNWKGNRTQAKCVYTIKHVTCNCRTFFCTINFQDFEVQILIKCTLEPLLFKNDSKCMRTLNMRNLKQPRSSNNMYALRYHSM